MQAAENLRVGFIGLLSPSWWRGASHSPTHVVKNREAWWRVEQISENMEVKAQRYAGIGVTAIFVYCRFSIVI